MKPIELQEWRLTEQPWGYETLLAETPFYTLKRLRYRAGKAGGLQYHMEKTESFHLATGRAFVIFELAGELVWREMFPGQTYTIPSGAPHQFHAIEECIVYEASTPHHDDRVNVAARYGREPDPNDLPTTWPPDMIAAFEAAQETG